MRAFVGRGWIPIRSQSPARGELITRQLGLSFPDGLPLAAAVDVVVEAERMGYTDCWSAEVSGGDAFTPLAAVAARTHRIRLGTAVVPASTRPPALLAMTSAALQDLSNGRFSLGLGSSTPAIVSRWMGLSFPPPLTRMRETIAAIRAATGAQRVLFHGKTLSVDGFRLDGAARDVPILVGALGPQMMRLAGEISDGLVLTLASRDFVPHLLESFYAGADEMGRDPEQLDVALTVPVVIDDPVALADVHASFASYGVLEVYNRYLARQGFTAEAKDLRDAFERRSRADAVAAVSDRMLDALSVSGDVDACVAQLDAYRRAGIKTMIVTPVTTEKEPRARKARLIEILSRLAPHA